MNITWEELKLMIEVCGPILGAFALFYFRLSKKIEILRQEAREDRKESDRKFGYLDAKFEHKFDRVDQKLDRILELFVIKNVQPPRTHFHKPKGKTA